MRDDWKLTNRGGVGRDAVGPQRAGEGWVGGVEAKPGMPPMGWGHREAARVALAVVVAVTWPA